MLPNHLMEKNLKVEVKLVEPSNDPYVMFRGQGIELVTRIGGKESGIYRGLTTAGKMILQPNLQWSVSLSKDDPSRPYITDSPSLITYEDVVHAHPRDMSELLERINARNEAEGIMLDPSCYI